MRFRAALGVTLMLATLVAPGLAAEPASAAPGIECKIGPGSSSLPDLWPQKRLDYERAWQVTRGAGVRVAVIDSGLNQFDPQLAGVHVLPGYDVIGAPFAANDTSDCYGHGTEVTSILAAQPSAKNNFAGIAPDATILPIKQTNTQGDKTGTAEGLARAIDRALAEHADVANISVTTPGDNPVLKAAVGRAARSGMIIVAAAGNDGEQANLPAYPAAYSTQFANVIAVSASDNTDQIPAFSETGRYVTVAAPGVNVPAIAGKIGYASATGTSFAAPYVTGTVALLKSAFPSMTAIAIHNRIIATADAPPATVPDRSYGYGIVNPYLAVTTLHDDVAPPPLTAAARVLPAARAVTPQNPHARNVALASAAVLLTLAVLALTSAAVLRGRRRPAVHST